MSTPRYRSHAGGVDHLHSHVVWCPKYRREVLVGEVETARKQLLAKKAKALDIQIEALEVMPDHVHLFVSAPPTLAPQQMANQFKGVTSRRLRQQFKQLRTRLPTLWSRSYYVGSAGAVTEETVQRSIAEQKTREKEMRRAFPYRLYPNRKQEQALATMLERHRHLSNRALAERKDAWEQEKRTVSSQEQSGYLKEERLTNSYLAHTNFSSCQATLKCLQRACENFFRRVQSGEKEPGSPRFKY